MPFNHLYISTEIVSDIAFLYDFMFAGDMCKIIKYFKNWLHAVLKDGIDGWMEEIFTKGHPSGHIWMSFGSFLQNGAFNNFKGVTMAKTEIIYPKNVGA